MPAQLAASASLLLSVPPVFSATILILPGDVGGPGYGLPAVYVEHDPLDVASLLARQKQHRRRDVFWHAHPPSGDGRRRSLPSIRVGETEILVRERRARWPRRNAVDRHATGIVLGGPRPCELLECRLRRPVECQARAAE